MLCTAQEYQNNEICKQEYHLVGNDQFSGVFLGSRRSKMFPTGFIGVCSLGVRKVILRVLTKNKIFYQLSFLEFYADSEFKIKFLRIWKFDRAWKTGLK